MIPHNAGINISNNIFRLNTLFNIARTAAVIIKNRLSFPFIDFAIFSKQFLYLPVVPNTP